MCKKAILLVSVILLTGIMVGNVFAAAPTFVAAGNVANGTGAITPALPAGIAVNDILLLFIETANQAISISNQNGGAWAAVANSPQGTGTAAGASATRLTVFWSRYNGTQGAPTVSDSGDHQLGRIIAVRGAITSGNPWDVTAGGVGATASTGGAIPGATTMVDNTLVVAAIATALPDATGTANFSAWANSDLTSITELTDNTTTSGNGGGLGIAAGVKATAGTYGNTTVTLANSSVRGMMSIALTATSPPGRASNPSPASGTTNVPLFPMVTLTWTPGAYVGAYTTGQAGNGHHVFFDTSSSTVSSGGTGTALGTAGGHFRSTTTSFDPANCIIDNADTYGQTRYGNPLPSETTFYWSIMEVNDANTGSPWYGPVWNFTTISEKATSPTPASGTQYYTNSGQTKDVSLSWTPGPDAADTLGHDVYFDTNSTTVTNATTATPGTYKGRQTPTSYAANGLAGGYTYYWRIDEVNGTNIWKGNVWNFKVGVNGSPGLVEEFKDLTGWGVGAYYTLTDVYDANDANDVTDVNALQIVCDKTANDWASFTYSFAAVNLSDNPRLTIKVKANQNFNLNMSVWDESGNYAYPTIGGSYTEIVASDNYKTYTFNFAGVTGVDLHRIVMLNFVFNPGSLYCSNTTAWFKDLYIAGASVLEPGITVIPSQLDIINSPKQTIPFRGVSNGAGGTSGITITATSSNTGLIPNPTVEYTGSSTGYLAYTPVADQTGTATITVDVSAPATAPADNIMHFDVEVEENIAPDIDQVAAFDAKAGDPQVVQLTGIDDGNPSAEQAITVTATSSNPGLIPNPTVAYNSDDSFGSLTFTPTLGQTGSAAITVTLQDNGGTRAGGVDTNEMVFDVNVYAQINNPPTIDSIGTIATFINTDVNVPLAGISDGDGGSQTLTITATSSNTGLVPNPTVVYTSPNSTGQLQFTPVAGQTGTATITVTVTDNGGAPNNNGNKSTQITFPLQVRVKPITGFLFDYSQCPPFDPNWSNGEGCHFITQVNSPPNGLLQIVVDKTITGNPWAGEWYSLPAELDMSAHPYISIVMKEQTVGTPSNNQMLIFLWDAFDHYNTDTPVQKSVGLNLTEYYFDWSALANQTQGGVPINMKRIKALLFNFAPGVVWKGTYYFQNLKVGDQADIAPRTSFKVSLNPEPDFAVAKNCGAQDVNLTGISDGNLGLKTVTVTAVSNNTGLIPNPTVGAVSGGNATLTYTPNTDQTGRATITVTAACAGSDPNVKAFIVDVLDRAAGGSTVTVAVNPATTYQSMDGFGVFCDNSIAAWGIPLVKDLGTSIVRTGIIDTEFEPTPANSDPNVLNLNGYNFSALPMSVYAGLKSSVDKFWLTWWSPPAWMKTNHSLADDYGQNTLEPCYYPAFATEAVAVVKAIKATTGVDLYGLSLQNEPQFSEPYASSHLDPTTYRDLIKVVGPRLKAAGLNTKLIWAEALQAQGTVQSYIETTDADPIARQYANVVAIHGGNSASTWANIYGWAQEAPAKKLWMSETSGMAANWSGGIDLGTQIYTALTGGNISDWNFWGFDNFVDTLKNPNPLYWASKHYYKYIRPGAIRVGCTSGSANILAVAFTHPTNQTVTLVLINNGTSSYCVNVTGSVLPATFAVYTSSNQRNFEQEPNVTDGLVLLPPSSITTLTGTTASALPPGQADDPSPVTGATVGASVLSWTAGGAATSHDVYFGTSSPGTFIGNQAGTTYNPGPLKPGTTYYWRIDEKNAGGTTTGLVWMFTTSTAGGQGDFNGDGYENFIDFAIFAEAWKSKTGDSNYNSVLDIAAPLGSIDESDLRTFAGNWLKGY